jgi:hypothetical protein
MRTLEDITDERLHETVETNIYGYFYMARAALPHLKKGACIINTGSVTGLKGSKQLLDYSATKGAIHAFTMSLASSVLEKGIRVNAVAPGPVWTPLNPADQSAEEITEFGKQTDFKRAAQPEELSPAYVFLAAPVCSSYITGIVLPVTGSVGSDYRCRQKPGSAVDGAVGASCQAHAPVEQRVGVHGLVKDLVAPQAEALVAHQAAGRGREHHDLAPRRPSAHRPQHVEAGAGRVQQQVDDGHVPAVGGVGQPSDGIGCRAALADRADVRQLGQGLHEALADGRVVLDDESPDCQISCTPGLSPSNPASSHAGGGPPTRPDGGRQLAVSPPGRRCAGAWLPQPSECSTGARRP